MCRNCNDLVVISPDFVKILASEIIAQLKKQGITVKQKRYYPIPVAAEKMGVSANTLRIWLRDKDRSKEIDWKFREGGKSKIVAVLE